MNLITHAHVCYALSRWANLSGQTPETRRKAVPSAAMLGSRGTPCREDESGRRKSEVYSREGQREPDGADGDKRWERHEKLIKKLFHTYRQTLWRKPYI